MIKFKKSTSFLKLKSFRLDKTFNIINIKPYNKLFNFLNINKMKKLIVFIIWIMILFTSTFSAYWVDSWSIIPNVKDKAKVKADMKWKMGAGEVWNDYNKLNVVLEKNAAKKAEESVWKAFYTWIFTWNTLFWFIKHLIVLISEVGLLIGAIMIILSWYKYAWSVITWNANSGKEPMKLAIQGVLIIVFSYAILRFMIFAFLEGGGI